MALTTSLVVLFSSDTADILKKLLQQCFLFFIVVVILGHNLGNGQVSVYRTIGPTLVFISVTVCVYPSFSIIFLWYVVGRITKKTAFLQM